MRFSILIPAFKRKYLYEAINSCLSQTYGEYEVIIVDDEWDEAIEGYREVEKVDYEVCVCTKCGYEERI